MALIQFTVQHDLLATTSDSSDADADADLIPLIGDVTFTPQIDHYRQLLAAEYLPRPTGFRLLPITGYIGMDGRLRSVRNGSLGVRLTANDPVLGLAKLPYRVDFHMTTPLGEPVRVDGGVFDAPSTDVSIWLVNALSGGNVNPILNLIDGGFHDSVFDALIDSGEPSDISIDIYDGGNV